MLNAKEIEIEIARLEYMESSYPNYAKLADLYAIRNEINRNTEKSNEKEEASPSVNIYRDASIENFGASDFLCAITGKDEEKVLTIINDLMDTLRVAQPRAYKNVMRKIESISEDDK